MPIAAAVLVGPADIRSRRGNGLLTCLGLRSGACLCLYDAVSKVGGMVHITDSEAGEPQPSRPGRYASSAVEALTQNIERSGAVRSRLIAAVIGGAEVSLRGAEDDTDTLILDSGVCRTVELELQRHNIPIGAKEVGGKSDRSVVLDVAQGTVTVKTADNQTLHHLQAKRSQSAAA